DVKLVGEERREVVERVSGVPQSGEKEDRRTRTAEVEIVQSHARRDPHHAAFVMGRVAPCIRGRTGGRPPGRRAAHRAECEGTQRGGEGNAITERPCPTTALWRDDRGIPRCRSTT